MCSLVLLKRSRTKNHTESFTQCFCLLPTLCGKSFVFFYSDTQWLAMRWCRESHFPSLCFFKFATTQAFLPGKRYPSRGMFGPGWPVIRGLGRALVALEAKYQNLRAAAVFFVCSWQFLAFSLWLLLAHLPVPTCWTEGLSNHLFLAHLSKCCL